MAMTEAQRMAAAERLADNVWQSVLDRRAERAAQAAESESAPNVIVAGSYVAGDQVGHSGGTYDGDFIIG